MAEWTWPGMIGVGVVVLICIGLVIFLAIFFTKGKKCKVDDSKTCKKDEEWCAKSNGSYECKSCPDKCSGKCDFKTGKCVTTKPDEEDEDDDDDDEEEDENGNGNGNGDGEKDPECSMDDPESCPENESCEESNGSYVCKCGAGSLPNGLVDEADREDGRTYLCYQYELGANDNVTEKSSYCGKDNLCKHEYTTAKYNSCRAYNEDTTNLHSSNSYNSCLKRLQEADVDGTLNGKLKDYPYISFTKCNYDKNNNPYCWCGVSSKNVLDNEEKTVINNKDISNTENCGIDFLADHTISEDKKPVLGGSDSTAAIYENPYYDEGS